MKHLSIFTVMLLLIFSIASVQADSAKIESARQAALQGEVRTGIIQLKDILQQDPENAEARFTLGEIYLRYGDAASAEKELRRAQLLGIPATRVSELILDAYLAQAKFEEISEYLKKQTVESAELQATFKSFDGFVQLSEFSGSELTRGYCTQMVKRQSWPVC